MTEPPLALEPTFADAIKTITAATDLPEPTRRHWCSSLVGIARAFDQPPEVLPARFSAVRAGRGAEDAGQPSVQCQGRPDLVRQGKRYPPSRRAIVACVGPAPRPADGPEHPLPFDAADAVLLRRRHRTRRRR